MNTSDQPLQNEDLAEEIDAINAIYEPSTITLTSTTSTTSSDTNAGTDSASNLPISTTIILQIPDHPHISFLLGFDDEYPSTPPRVLGPASTGSRGEGKKWVDILSESAAGVWAAGSVCLYDLIVEAGERFDQIKATKHEEQEESEQVVSAGKSTEAVTTATAPVANSAGAGAGTGVDAVQSLLGSLGLDSPPDWIMSDPISEKKSVFVARVASVQSKEQAEKYLDHLLATEKKVASATHNITAWRIRQRQQRKVEGLGSNNANAVVQDFDDDGESAAGGRLLHLMQLMDVRDVVVVVTRWYGGVKLGPDRFRLINAAARDALVKGRFDKAESTEGPGKGKKKGKR